MLPAFIAYTVYSKWASIRSNYIVKLAIIHEHFEKLEIFLPNPSFVDHVNLEPFRKQMPFERLKQYHLPCPQHAAPSGIRPQSGSNQILFNIIPVCKPCNSLETDGKLTI